MSKHYDEVIIIGGSIAGLASAIALSPFASRVTILEASSYESFHDAEAGAAVQLSDNGLKALQFLSADLLQKVFHHAVDVQKNYMVLPSGNELYDTITPLPPQGTRTLMMRWGMLRKLLFEAIPKDSFRIEFNTLVKDFTAGILTAVRQDGEERYPISDRTLLVAADGSKSAFRPTPLQYSPRLNVKAAISFSNFPSHFESHATYSYLGNPEVACFLGPAGPHHYYWAISLATENPEAVNLSIDQLIARLTSPETKIWRELLQATPPHKVFFQPSGQADIPEEMVHGNVVLVGDAAHCMSGSYGQSACLALEDAVTLATGPLLHYTPQRRQRCLDLQAASQQRATQAVNVKSDAPQTMSDWIYQWDVPTACPRENSNGPYAVIG
ncbi:hypothetical protein FisN_7Hh169 [Fistulifera solaris]|uniref:FAD-binding domain-containing protein n=1 Tax=Fistulifera solaris TaxID=1519565 RepID=A0A1Z5K3M4_FISSO|nr:hypothetical protein FisN_7Hh169 [Fistulifera solaris]|eukprot:GAX20853.1 hypothetical protein FisN_7Hh169 [Fistulifera solaris]